MRTARIILSIAALFWGFLQAPFYHVHAEELDHPAITPAHFHVHSAAALSGIQITAHTADDDDIEIEWAIAQPDGVALVADLSVSAIARENPLTAISSVGTTPSPRGHDPPDFTPKQPRSPPA